MTFVHVVTGDAAVTEIGENRNTAHSENYFLAETVVRIASVQAVRQPLVPRRVLRQGCVEQVNRDHVAAEAFDEKSPGANSDVASFNTYRYHGHHRFEHFLGFPKCGAFRLV